MIEIITKTLSIMTLLSHIGLLVLLAIFIFKQKFKFAKKVVALSKKYAMHIALTMASISTLASLYYSEIALYEPCKLCWFQRIFMYPLILIIGLSFFYKDKKITRYVIPMSIAGLIISGYHYFINIMPTKMAVVCSTTGQSCLVQYFLELNYINIPIMAFTSFLIIFVFAMMGRK